MEKQRVLKVLHTAERFYEKELGDAPQCDHQVGICYCGDVEDFTNLQRLVRDLETEEGTAAPQKDIIDDLKYRVECLESSWDRMQGDDQRVDRFAFEAVKKDIDSLRTNVFGNLYMTCNKCNGLGKVVERYNAAQGNFNAVSCGWCRDGKVLSDMGKRVYELFKLVKDW